MLNFNNNNNDDDKLRYLVDVSLFRNTCTITSTSSTSTYQQHNIISSQEICIGLFNKHLICALFVIRSYENILRLYEPSKQVEAGFVLFLVIRLVHVKKLYSYLD